MENENNKSEETPAEEYFVSETNHLSTLVKNNKEQEVLNKYGLSFLYSLNGEARILLEQEMGIKQKSAIDLFNLGVMALEKNDLKKAEANFIKAIQLDPEYASPHYNLALIYETRKEAAKAKKAWQSFVKKEEAYLQSHGNRISCTNDDFDYLEEAKTSLKTKKK